MIDSRTRRYLQFSLRGFLVVLTLGCVWLGCQVNRANARRQASAWVLQMGGTVLHDYEVDDAKPPIAAWLQDFYDHVVYVDLRNAEVVDLSRLANLKRIEHLCLWDTPVSDVTPLASLSDLRELNLSGTLVRDLAPLSDLKNLQELDLSDTRVRDLVPLSDLKNLKLLYLYRTQVRDLTPLLNLKGLRWLELRDTQVSDEQVTKLRQVLPNCGVVIARRDEIDLGNELDGAQLKPIVQQ